MHAHTGPHTPNPGRWVIPQFGPPSVLKWEELDANIESIPPPAGSALIRIMIAGIGGTDSIQRAGGYPNVLCSKPGFTPGYDIVGEIVSINSDDGNGDVLTEINANIGTDFQSGDLVASMCMIGGHATHITLPLTSIVKISPPLSSATSLPPSELLKIAALPLNFMTGFGMLQRSDANLPKAPDDKLASILVGSAAGGVGTAVAQLVHALNLPITMYGTCSPSKFGFVRDTLGMIPIDRHSSDIAEQVRKLTPDGLGVDVAFDAVASEESLRQSHHATKDGTGQVVVIGFMSEIRQDGGGMVYKDKSLDQVFEMLTKRTQKWPRTSIWGVERVYFRQVKDVWMQDFQRLLKAVREGTLNPAVSQLFKLSDAVKTHEILNSGAGVLGKMLFVVDEKLAKECHVV